LTRRIVVLVLAACVAACQQGGNQDQVYTEQMAQAHKDDVPTPTAATAERPALEVATQEVVYGTVKGRPVTGHLAYPIEAHGALPAIMVFHEWWGLNDNVKTMSDRLAGQGYVVLALDMFGGEVATTPEKAKELVGKAFADEDAIAANIRVAMTYMEKETPASSVATLGWCFGGALSFRAATMFPDKVAATVIYYGHVDSDPKVLEPLKMPILGIFGGADDSIPVAGVREFEKNLHQLGKEAEIMVFDGAGHAFANPSGKNYQAAPAEAAWQKTLSFLDTHLNEDIYQAPPP
jgi:carboxymethylenebutenolidase